MGRGGGSLRVVRTRSGPEARGAGRRCRRDPGGLVTRPRQLMAPIVAWGEGRELARRKHLQASGGACYANAGERLGVFPDLSEGRVLA